MTGRIVKVISGFYYVDVAGSGIYECRARGVFRQKKMKPLVGDTVEIDVLSEADREGNLKRILPRKSELIRPAVAHVDVYKRQAHECGHAIQHQKNYLPLKLRSAIVPAANLGSTLAWPLIIIGLLFTSETGNFLITLGIVCFSLAVLFQLVTLPVEFNASARAMRILGETGILGQEELSKTRKAVSYTHLFSRQKYICSQRILFWSHQ